MPAERVLDAIRTLAREADPRPDGELVRRFVRSADGDAFAELLRRHGPTVYAVCRRVLGHAHDAEDAFQAVWVVLARRAADVDPPGRVGHFLYGVAVRTATKARTMAAKRRVRELASGGRKPPVAGSGEERGAYAPRSPEQLELAAVLDEELARLPDKYRAAVVTCDLQGKSRSAAAAELGWPEGTVAARVAKGRELLAARLRARGVTLSVAGLVATLGTASAVPQRLAADVLAGTAPPSALALAESVMRTLSAVRWKVPLALLVAFGLAVGTGSSSRPRAAEPAAPAGPAAPAPKGDNVWKEAATIDTPGWLPGSVAYSPDGKVLLVGGTGGNVVAYDAATRKKLWEYKDGDHFAAVAHSRGVTEHDDGSQIGVTFKDGVKLLDPKTGKPTETLTEAGSAPTAVGFFRDTYHLAEVRHTARRVVFGNSQGYITKAWLVGGAPGTITTSTKQSDGYAVPLAVEPRMKIGPLAVMAGPIDRATGRNALWAYACGGGGNTALLEGHKATVTAAAWSADGTTVVTGDADGTVITWDGDVFKQKARVGFDRRVVAVAINADGSRVAAAVIANVQLEGGGEPSYHDRVHVWETKNPPKSPPALPIADDQPRGGPFAGLAGLAFAPDGKSLAAAFANFSHLGKLGRLVGKVRVWALPTPVPPAPPAPQKWKPRGDVVALAGGVNAVAWAPDGKLIAVGGSDTLRTYHAGTLKEASRVVIKEAEGSVWSVEFTPDGKQLAVANRNSSGFYEVANLAAGRGWGIAGQHRAMAVSPDGKRVAHADGREVQVRFTGDKLGITAMKTYSGADPAGKLPAAVAWSPDSRRLAAARHDATGRSYPVVVWDFADGGPEALFLGHSERVSAVAWSKDGATIAAGAAGGMVFLWDAGTGKERHRFRLVHRDGANDILAVAFSPDGRTLAIGLRPADRPGVNSVLFYDVATAVQVGYVLTDAIGGPVSVAYSPDGKAVAVGGRGDGDRPAGGFGVWALAD